MACAGRYHGHQQLELSSGLESSFASWQDQAISEVGDVLTAPSSEHAVAGSAELLLPGCFVTVLPSLGRLGVKFGKMWPVVKRVDSGNLADQFPEIRAGCSLLQIDGQPTKGMSFKQAVPLLVKRYVCSSRASTLLFRVFLLCV